MTLCQLLTIDAPKKREPGTIATAATAELRWNPETMGLEVHASVDAIGDGVRAFEDRTITIEHAPDAGDIASRLVAEMVVDCTERARKGARAR